MKRKTCKKLIAAIAAAAMFVFAGAGVLSTVFPSYAPVTASAAQTPQLGLISVAASEGAASHNIGMHNYYWGGQDINTGNWINKAKSFLAVNSDGTLTRAEYIGGNLVVEVYSTAFKRQSTKSVSVDLPIFGGVFFGSKYNFIVSGQENPSFSDSVEVVRVVKYDKSWKRLGALNLRGKNTFKPFDTEGVSMAETGGKLLIHTSHTMYPDKNGTNHQANMTFFIDEESLSPSYQNYLVSYPGYVSHSFNQVLRTDGSYVYTVDHGDAYPRAIVLVKRKLNGNIVESVNLLTLKGETGVNTTKATLGDMQLSGSKVLTVGVSVRQDSNYESNTQRNVFLSVAAKDGISTKSISWLTTYAEGAGWLVGNPYLVKTGSDRFSVLWEEHKGSTSRIRCAVINGSGTRVGSIYTLSEKAAEGLSDCAPVVLGSKIIWYSTGSRTDPWYDQKDAAPVFYQVPVDMSAIQAPAITAQPQGTTVVVGNNASFTVKATGTGLKYQWFFKKKNQASWAKWSGKTSATATATSNSTWQGMQVYCRVSNAAGNWVDSDPATIDLIIPVKITSHPASVAVGTGETVTFKVKASGTDVKYQWYFKKATATKWAAWSGKTAATISATSNGTWDGMQVYCKVTDTYGYTASSNTATITLSRPLEIITQPKNQSVVLGNSITLSVKAAGVLPTYQWYFMKKGQTTWSKWNNRTKATETVTPNASWNGIKLYCLITDRDNNTVKSNTITVTADHIIITSQPRVTFAKVGDTTYFTVNAKGNDSGLTYQWYYQKKNSTAWAKWPGKTSATISAVANNTWDSMKVYCKITDGEGHTKNSSSAIVTLCSEYEFEATLNVTIQQKIDYGENYKYQWYYKKAGEKIWTAWSGKTTSSIAIKVDSSCEGMLFHCRIYDSDGFDRCKMYSRVKIVG